MVEQYVKPGNRIEISLQSDRINKTYTSKVEEILNDDKILIYAPLSYGILVKLPAHRKYDFVFNTEYGIMKATGSIVSHISRDGLVLAIAKIEHDFEKIQRREFFRFKCVIPFSYIYLGELDESNVTEQDIVKASEKYNDIPRHEGLIKDICGGGLRFSTNADIEVSKIVQCVIQLHDTYVALTTKVLYKDQLFNGNYSFELRGRFVNITKTDQEKIVQYIFDEQRRILQRQKGTEGQSFRNLL